MKKTLIFNFFLIMASAFLLGMQIAFSVSHTYEGLKILCSILCCSFCLISIISGRIFSKKEETKQTSDKSKDKKLEKK